MSQEKRSWYRYIHKTKQKKVRESSKTSAFQSFPYDKPLSVRLYFLYYHCKKCLDRSTNPFLSRQLDSPFTLIQRIKDNSNLKSSNLNESEKWIYFVHWNTCFSFVEFLWVLQADVAVAIFALCKLFTLAPIGGYSLKSEWQQVSSNLHDPVGWGHKIHRLYL